MNNEYEDENKYFCPIINDNCYEEDFLKDKCSDCKDFDEYYSS